MCKKILDILHITNMFGKDRKCVTYGNIPSDSSITINIKWTGERLGVLWTIMYGRSGPGNYIQNKNTYTDGNMSEESFNIRQDRNARISGQKIYFDCTNVTYLEVNGEQLI